MDASHYGILSLMHTLSPRKKEACLKVSFTSICWSLMHGADANAKLHVYSVFLLGFDAPGQKNIQ
jgi:hypothetical protein